MRAVIFIDGQNLFHTAKYEFDLPEKYPVYNPRRIGDDACGLVTALLRARNEINPDDTIELAETRFYTGIPDPKIDPRLHGIWRQKLAQAEKDGVKVVQRALKYIPRGDKFDRREKGIDVRIALDVLMLGLRQRYDVAVLFSRDGDFAEVANELKALRGDTRFSHLQLVCCYPRNELKEKRIYGVAGWIWCPFDKRFFDKCRETRDYSSINSDAA
jgi:uncharacterized LabA/DUF88 family protein